MSTAAHYPHLTLENGSARIGSTRYTVLYLASEHYHYGWTAEELLRQHPDLRPEEVYSALTFFYDHYELLVREIKVATDSKGVSPDQSTFSRAELLKRKSAAGM